MSRLVVIATSLVLFYLPWTAAADEVADERVEVYDLRAPISALEAQQEEAVKARADRSESIAPGWLPPVGSGVGIPTLNLRGFGHAQYNAGRFDRKGAESDVTNNFGVGGVDLFITSRIAEDFSFVNETVFELGEDGAVLDVERVLLKYAPTDGFEARIGRGHTPLGYWNETYHHGVWLRTTADRPLVYAFEDDGGILPVHFVGVEAAGHVRTGYGLVSYDAVISNGRGSIPDEVQLVVDANDSKAYALLLRFEPDAIPGLGFGLGGYYDMIPPDKDTTGRGKNMPEAIASAHLLYLTDPIEFLAEGIWIWHRDRTEHETLRSYGGYAQLGYACGQLKPYYRFDWLAIDEDDLFFAGLDKDQLQHTLGIRWDIRTFVAMKLEASQNNADSANAQAATVQFSFAF